MRRYAISYQEFARGLRQSPRLFYRLLSEEADSFSDSLCTQLLTFYAALTDADFREIYHVGKLSATREADILRISGLPATLSHLPLLLYRRHCDNIDREYAAHGEYHLSDEEVEATLTTGGQQAIEYVFAVEIGSHRAVCDWDCVRGGWRVWNMEVEAEAKRCFEYLARRGAVFHSRRELLAHARRQGWPKANELELPEEES